MNTRQTAHALPESLRARTPGRILVADHDGMYLIKFVGDVRVNLCAAVDDFLAEMFRDEDFKSVLVDLTATEGIDSTSLGILAKLSIKASDLYGFTPTLVSTNVDITRVLRTVGFDDVVPTSSKSPWWRRRRSPSCRRRRRRPTTCAGACWRRTGR